MVQALFRNFFFFYTAIGRGVASRDPTHVTPKVRLCIHTIYQVCSSKDVLGQITIFGLFGPDMKTEVGAVI